MKNRIFAFLTFLFVLVLLELGSFVILSLTQGELVGYGDLQTLRASRIDEEPAEEAPDAIGWSELRVHRLARLPVLHPYIGFVPDPVPHMEAARPGYSRQSTEYGFPANQTDLLRPVDDDETVIGVFGGSVAANLSSGGRPLSEFLGKTSARLAGRKVTVLCFAIAGGKQPQQLMALNYLLTLGVHLDMVIVLDGFNEVALPAVTNVPLGYNAVYPRGWPLLVGDLDPSQRRRAGELIFQRERRSRRAALFSRPPLSWSLTAGLLWKVADAPITRRITELELSFQESGDEELSYTARGPSREYASQDAMLDDLVLLWKRTSLLMESLCRGRGIEYYHFLQPNQYVPGSKPLSAEEMANAWKEDNAYKPVVEKAYPRLRAAGRELRDQGVDFVDLTDIFADHPETLYRDDCCHVIRKGDMIMAREIAATIDRRTPDA